jgi:hypothetical protein
MRYGIIFPEKGNYNIEELLKREEEKKNNYED